MITHRKSKTREYRIWKGIRRRCTSDKHIGWKDYGGRGITVCAEWNSFINFYNDMGNCPEGYEIDRINNDLGYSKTNCRWATKSENAINRRKRKRASMIGAEHYATNLDDATVMAIKIAYASGLGSYSQLALKYGVAASTIQDMVKGRTWKHLLLLPSPPRKKHQPSK